MKITVVGAGNVGATCANVIAQKGFAEEVVLLDIKEGIAEGKAMDIMQSSSILGFDSLVTGVTNDYSKTANSKVVVITSGLPRKPGMTREDLIGTNANIVSSVVDSILTYSPNAIIIVVSNPMDTMTYLALKKSGKAKNQIIGMGGILDSARFNYFLNQAIQGSKPSEIEAQVIAGHSDTTMVPVVSNATHKGNAVANILDNDTIQQVVKDTMVGGATCTKLLGTSAWIAPGAAAAALTEAIALDKKTVFPCSVYLDGEYGQKDICIGVPVSVGANGVEKIIEYSLSADEQAAFNTSADAVRNMNNVLKELNVL